MSDFQEQRDQAQQLREKMHVKQQELQGSEDALSLPPRSKIHQAKDEKKKTKLKLKFPLLRFLTLLIVLLPIAFLGYTYHQNNQMPATSKVTKEQLSHSEKISIGSNKKSTVQEEEDKDNTNEEIVSDETEEMTEQPEDTSISSQSDTKASEDVKIHVVLQGETLYSISQLYYNSRDGEALIKEWNKLSENKVEQGQVLEIPLKLSNATK
ncbi:LysM peptidoglycan-binding domain-containing protein [Bacillus pinisoli]|uniref:LysM peptidoglycan-binding domain-containing protein n=1 Tax=Bacillus pinisoli TaxID=2901866 RepID=UPI001FF15FCA|nr:LysM peptidoglycan-binding domain-containing protein [Bacillus pinisoli]